MKTRAAAQFTRRAMLDVGAQKRVELLLRVEAFAVLPREMERLGHDARRCGRRIVSQPTLGVGDPLGVGGPEQPLERLLVGDELTVRLVGRLRRNLHGIDPC